jgi:uncharacterized phiE125 gp8 family phage protein
MENGKTLHSLVSLRDFQALLGVDAREEALCTFLLVTATYSIEQYCRRHLLIKKHTDYLDYFGDGVLGLREYPVKKIYSVHNDLKHAFGQETILASDVYYCLPDAGIHEDVPFFLAFKTSRFKQGEKVVKVKYVAGYSPADVPPDLKSACIELAAWNMTRYRGRRIGLTGSVRGRAGEGEHLEVSMPENVKSILEPYRRKMI